MNFSVVIASMEQKPELWQLTKVALHMYSRESHNKRRVAA